MIAYRLVCVKRKVRGSRFEVPGSRFENEEAEQIHNLLAEGDEVYMKMGETFFAHRFGQLRDKFGTSWMVVRSKMG
jgi:uncharacterized glyoxalase superfamily protein PhnB